MRVLPRRCAHGGRSRVTSGGSRSPSSSGTVVRRLSLDTRDADVGLRVGRMPLQSRSRPASPSCLSPTHGRCGHVSTPGAARLPRSAARHEPLPGRAPASQLPPGSRCDPRAAPSRAPRQRRRRRRLSHDADALVTTAGSPEHGCRLAPVRKRRAVGAAAAGTRTSNGLGGYELPRVARQGRRAPRRPVSPSRRPCDRAAGDDGLGNARRLRLAHVGEYARVRARLPADRGPRPGREPEPRRAGGPWSGLSQSALAAGFESPFGASAGFSVVFSAPLASPSFPAAFLDPLP